MGLMQKIAIIGAGGTLSMVKRGDGLLPARSASELVGEIRHLVDDVEIVAVDAFQGASANLGFPEVHQLAEVSAQLVTSGASGIVILQGTDTLEETSFALELMSELEVPIVMTGGMRGASALGADGPANIKSAILVASSAGPKSGVLVVVNDEAHAARYVHKSHTTALGAFSSGEFGLAGRIQEDKFCMYRGALPSLMIAADEQPRSWPRVALIRIVIGDDGHLVEAVGSSGYSGCVIEAMGAGHVPAAIVPALEELANRIPVILVSRTGAGMVCKATYAYAGAEIDLLKRGLIWGGALSGLKARVLLTLCLRLAPERAAAEFQRVTALV